MSGEPLQDHSHDTAGSVNLQSQAAKSPEATSSAAPQAPQAPQAAPATQSTQATQSATTGATQEAANRAIHQAGRVLRLGADEVRLFIVSNPYSIQMMSFVGGLVLLVVSLLGVINVPEILLNPLDYLKNVYELLFSIVICAIDGPGDRVPSLKLKLLTYASFLHNNTGRAIFYLFLACLEGEQNSWYRVAVGWYFAFIGVAHGVLSCWQSGRGQTSSTEQADNAPSAGAYTQAA